MKTLLVLEGGAFRGTYTAAIIDKFIEDGINIDAIIGYLIFSVSEYFIIKKLRIITFYSYKMFILRYFWYRERFLLLYETNFIPLGALLR